VSQYQFNAKGERVRKYKGTTDQSRYLYNEGGQLLIQNKVVSGVTTTQEMIWLDDMPIGVSQGGTLHGILTDHLNTPRAVFEMSTQKTVWRWNAVDDAFGESLASEDPDANGTLFKLDMRFSGQFYDAESGMAYNYYRDCYEASTGRYCESDPIGLSGGISTYSYVGGNPINGVDASGLELVTGNRRGSAWSVGPVDANEYVTHSPWRQMGNGMMSFIHPDPFSLINKAPFLNAEGKNECVEIVKQGYPDSLLMNTSAKYGWFQGPKVDVSTPVGTAIASGWVNGMYPSNSGRNHAALYSGWGGYEIRVIDQFSNKPYISERPLSLNAGPYVNPSNDGSAFYIILWKK
jgi:RHS repeat-associated protein